MILRSATPCLEKVPTTIMARHRRYTIDGNTSVFAVAMKTIGFTLAGSPPQLRSQAASGHHQI